MAKTIESPRSLTPALRLRQKVRESSPARRIAFVASLAVAGMVAATVSFVIAGDEAAESVVSPSPAIEAAPLAGVETQALTPAQLADAARWTAIARASGVTLTPAQLADAARWTAVARASGVILTPAQLADAARWTAIARASGVILTPAQLADAARWTAIVDAYLSTGNE